MIPFSLKRAPYTGDPSTLNCHVTRFLLKPIPLKTIPNWANQRNYPRNWKIGNVNIKTFVAVDYLDGYFLKRRFPCWGLKFPHSIFVLTTLPVIPLISILYPSYFSKKIVLLLFLLICPELVSVACQ